MNMGGTDFLSDLGHEREGGETNVKIPGWLKIFSTGSKGNREKNCPGIIINNNFVSFVRSYFTHTIEPNT
jgi:hypothetical protein